MESRSFQLGVSIPSGLEPESSALLTSAGSPHATRGLTDCVTGVITFVRGYPITPTENGGISGGTDRAMG